MRVTRAIVFLTVVLFCTGVYADGEAEPAPPPPPNNEERLQQVEAENKALRTELDGIKLELKGLREEKWPPSDVVVGRSGASAESAATSTGLGTKGGVFSKPFLHQGWGGVTVGGYFDFEWTESQASDSTFRQHRLVPFIYSEINDQLRFATEIEFEDGGPDSASGDGEVKVEFATLDYMPSRAFGIRAGAILAPLGKFNLIHDSPVNDLTERPLVSQFVIPTTLTEAGVGVFGSVDAGEEGQLDYEVYLVNGFRGLVEDSTALTGFTSNFNDVTGLREGRASLKRDNNASLAGVGRLAYSPFLGCELGVSSHGGRYDANEDNNLFIYAFDAVYIPIPPLEFQGEIARAEISRDAVAELSGVPDDEWGWYGQANYHFMPQAFRELLPNVFREESTFTAVTRVDHVELDDNRRERVTLGMNFRPIEGAVFKFDYQFNLEDWARNRVHDDAILFSVASYF